ncbi:hypothetical protein G9A89_021742 [Geosiphon pyriformis]|nr:hypothetical protein G9A89_021742 [Geosiphon pyriformis]
MSTPISMKPLPAILYIFNTCIINAENDEKVQEAIKKYLERNNLSPKEAFELLIEYEPYNCAYKSLLASFYFYGIGTKISYSHALTLYQSAAVDLDDPFAQNQVGWCYYAQLGCEKDVMKALEWYKKSAEGGCARGQCNLGYFYQTGLGTEQDVKKAFFWYEKSALAGDVFAQLYLGDCYRDEIGTTRNPMKALYWHQQAANGGNPTGKNLVGYCYHEGIGTKKEPLKARHWFQRSAESKDISGLYNYANCCRYGWGKVQDIHEAIRWYRKSIQVGNETAPKVIASIFTSA